MPPCLVKTSWPSATGDKLPEPPALADAVLSAQVSNALFDFPNAAVTASDGRAQVTLKVLEEQGKGCP